MASVALRVQMTSRKDLAPIKLVTFLRAASYLCELAEGKTLDDLARLDHNDLVDALGREIVTQRTRCATLSLETLRAAIRKRQS